MDLKACSAIGRHPDRNLTNPQHIFGIAKTAAIHSYDKSEVFIIFPRFLG
jgi:hypothetical protein